MISNVAVPGGWELLLMFIIPTTMLAAILLAVYAVVRVATRPRPLPDEHQRN